METPNNQQEPDRSSAILVPLAQQRAPTLLVGESGSGQGLVQTWVPNRIRSGIGAVLLTSFGLTSLAAAIWTLFSAIHFGPLYMLVAPLVLFPVGVGAFAWAWELVRYPAYLSADEEGIGMSSRNRSRALRWSEIEGVQDNGYYFMLAISGNPDRCCTLDLEGYSRRTRELLLEIIITRAGLTEDPFVLNHYSKLPVEFRARAASARHYFPSHSLPPGKPGVQTSKPQHNEGK